MSIFKKLTFRQKMMLPGIIVLLGFVAIAFIYNYGLSVSEEADKKFSKISELNEIADELYVHMLQERNREKDLLTSKDTVYFDKQEEVIKEMGELINKLEELNRHDELSVKIDSAKEHLKDYQKGFQHVNTLKNSLGRSEKEGLIGDVRANAHDAERILKDNPDLALLNSLLMMRRHEKDYLSRVDDKYRVLMAEEETRFAGLVKESSLPSSVKRELSGKIKKYNQTFFALIESNKSMGQELGDFFEKVHVMESEVEQLLEMTHGFMDSDRQSLTSTIQNITIFFYVALVIIAILVIAPLIWVVRDISSLVSSVHSSGNQVASSVSTISSSAKELETTARENTATTCEVAASVKEITATTKDLGNTMEDVNLLSQETAELASNGKSILESMDANMSRMSEASRNISEKLSVLSKKTENISNMVTTISRVAEQTNLLSLNAAIEAEKAGEYGLGFSVVATEIRRLADQTAVATYDIEHMVNEVQPAVSAGVMSMDKFSDEIHNSIDNEKEASRQLEKIIEQVQILAPHIESISEGLRAQTEGTEQINEAMINLSEADQQSIISIRQVNSSLDDLNGTAHGLEEGIKCLGMKKGA